MGKPVRVICIEQDGIEQQRNIYIRAALYFLANKYDNTMSVSGKILDVFNIAKTKINTYVDTVSASSAELIGCSPR